jgi:hypothetical protein
LDFCTSDFGGNIELLSWDARVLDGLSEFDFIAIDWGMLAWDAKAIVGSANLGLRQDDKSLP